MSIYRKSSSTGTLALRARNIQGLNKQSDVPSQLHFSTVKALCRFVVLGLTRQSRESRLCGQHTYSLEIQVVE
jgi:hypothetical protein